MIIQLDRYFNNIFSHPKITSPRMIAFTRDHLVKLNKTNPGGIYNGLIASTQNLLAALEGDVQDTSGGRSTRKSVVFAKNQARLAATDYVTRQQGLIKSVFGRKSPEYKEFFTHGVNMFRHATDQVFGQRLHVMIKQAEKYEAQLGSAFKNELTALTAAYDAAQEKVGMGKAGLNNERIEQGHAKTALQQQLCANLCTIAAHNIGKPEMMRVYFNPHLLFAAKRHQLFKGKVAAGETRLVCEFKYADSKRFHILVTGTDELRFQMAVNGIDVGRQVEIKPGVKFNESFEFFSSNGNELRVTNPSVNPGSYMVWEVS